MVDGRNGPRLAQIGHDDRAERCPIPGVKRTWLSQCMAVSPAGITLDPRQDARRGAIDQHILYPVKIPPCRTGRTLKAAGL